MKILAEVPMLPCAVCGRLTMGVVGELGERFAVCGSCWWYVGPDCEAEDFLELMEEAEEDEADE